MIVDAWTAVCVWRAQEAAQMLDLLFVVVTLAFFAIAVAYIGACDRL